MGTEAEATATEAEAADATAAVLAALSGGRLAEARAQATAALERYGPDPALFLLLGRAHAVENEDDHDDEAERAYRRGLEAFPDHLDLLAAYAALCLESDALDRPGRHARGPVLAARVRALAPGSPQAREVDRIGRGIGLDGAATGGGRPSLATPIPRSAAHAQRHDVRTALANSPSLTEAARQAEEDARRYPYDLRRIIRAETLTALGRPGRRLLLGQVRAPLLSVLVALALGAVALIPGPASPLPVWAAAAALLTIIPNRMLTALESRARTRGLARLLPPPAPADSDPAYSMLPPPPAPGARDFAVLGTALTLAVFAVVSPPLLVPRTHTEPPRSTTSAPDTFLGKPLLSARPAVAGLDSRLASVWLPPGGGSFSYVYGNPEVPMADGSLLTTQVFGTTGDSRTALNAYEQTLAGAGSVVDATWDGPTGAPVHCVSYATGDEEAGAHVACSWSGDDSSGTVVTDGSGLSHNMAVVDTMMAWGEIVHQGADDSSP
ncbi:hypothetical protein [Streptomyces sp. NPDC096323]|uniref:hypothetical protein n=1 Tax=Streptomyces sp. NPDC096323 TaxID=3155822 RepID=UPI0033344A47